MNNFLSREKREQLQTMSNLIRYNTTTHIHNEDVAEHSFYVAFYTMQICDSIGIKGEYKLAAIEYALIHDVHEIVLSDIPHNVKAAVPALGKLCEEFEVSYNSQTFPDLMSRINQFSDLDIKLIISVVVLADVLSVKQYAIQECKYGNVEHYTEIEENANSRIKAMIETITSIRGEAVGMILDDLFKKEL